MAHGIEFDETMVGPFVLGEVDPERGRIRGESGDTRLAMDVTVQIADLQDFVASPEHVGALVGTINFPPLGNELATTGGVFNLFSPTDDPKLKLMTYELEFRAKGNFYYLYGEKRVRDDGGIDWWSDTTTLYTTVYGGANRSGRIVGAGVLSLPMVNLMDLLTTVRVTGTRSTKESAATLACFGMFFIGELWNVYGPEVLQRHGLD